VSADVETLPNEHDLVDGQFASVGVADVRGEPLVFVMVTAEAADRVNLDGWFLPASSELLRGIARDLVAGADALDEL